MAATARTKADCKEFFDDQKTLQTKIKRLAELIRNSKHFCAFTGAGISTAAGIADFRSGINTVLDTGTGKWAAMSAKKQGKSKQIKKNKRSTRCIKAVPTASHMALVALATAGPKYLKCMISQNTDGLHRRSGMPVDMLCELHGNTTLEVCDVCGRGYMRDHDVCVRNKSVHDHRTGRYCTVPKCGGKLHDTIINFNEDLNKSVLGKALDHTNECDVMLALGSSLVVSPACDIPGQIGDSWELQKSKGQTPTNHLVIVNLQKTPLDDVCSLRIFAKIDDVMVPLMKELGLAIPQWRLQRFMKVTVEPIAEVGGFKWSALTISAVDVDGINATVFSNVKLTINGKAIEKVSVRGNVKQQMLSGDESRFEVTNQIIFADDTGLVAELSFFGNYSEPNLSIPLDPYLQQAIAANDSGDSLEFVCRLAMDIETKQWTVEMFTSENELVILDLEEKNLMDDDATNE